MNYDLCVTGMDFEKEIQLIDWHREPAGLYAPIEYTLASGGKRVRPRLALMAAAMYGKEEKALPVALALEIFHNFTLLHDDLMDKAPTRRGRQTVYLRWDENTAVLSGDQMLIEAYKQLEKLPADKLPHVLYLFSKMATEICEGQQMDMDFEKREDVSTDEYMEMIRLKTSVLLGAALEMGAYVADAPAEEQAALREAGVQAGLAFQIQDDILDTYGDSATFGKQTGGDIMQNKKTLLLLTALGRANEEQQMLFNRWLHAESRDIIPEEKISAVRALYDATGARNACEERMRRCTETALAALDKVKTDTTALRELIISMINRVK